MYFQFLPLKSIVKYGHYGIMAIVAIGAIVHPGHQYGCQKKRMELRIAASEANLA